MGRAFEYRKARKMARWGAMAVAFTRIGREIAMSVKQGGADPNTNPRLRAAIQNAKNANMPKTNWEAAIKRASDKDSSNYEEIQYEGYGPHGVAIIVETATDNNNRTVANIRSHFNKCGGALGNLGSVSFMFDKLGVFEINPEGKDLEELELELIDAGLEELSSDEDGTFAYCGFNDFGAMQKKLEDMNIEIKSSKKEQFANVMKEDLTEAQVADLNKLLDRLDEDEDVTAVYHNMKE